METIGILSLVKDVYVPLTNIRRFTAIFTTIDTIVAEIQQAQDSSGTGTKAITGLQLSETGAGTYIISGQVDLLDGTQTPGSEFDHVAIIVTSGTVVVLGLFSEDHLELPPDSLVTIAAEVCL